MTDPTKDTIARMIRSAPYSPSVDFSEELAERIIRTVRAMDEEPELEPIGPPPKPLRRPDVDVERLKRRLREVARAKAAEYAEDEESRARRVIVGVLEIIEAEVPLVGRARAVIEAVREAWGNE